MVESMKPIVLVLLILALLEHGQLVLWLEPGTVWLVWLVPGLVSQLLIEKAAHLVDEILLDHGVLQGSAFRNHRCRSFPDHEAVQVSLARIFCT